MNIVVDKGCPKDMYYIVGPSPNYPHGSIVVGRDWGFKTELNALEHFLTKLPGPYPDSVWLRYARLLGEELDGAR